MIVDGIVVGSVHHCSDVIVVVIEVRTSVGLVHVVVLLVTLFPVLATQVIRAVQVNVSSLVVSEVVV